MRFRYSLIPAIALVAVAALAIGRHARPSAPAARSSAPAIAIRLPSFEGAPAAVRDIAAELMAHFDRAKFLELLKLDPTAAKTIATALFPFDEEFLVDYVDDVPTLRNAKRRDLAVARLARIVTDESADALYAFLMDGEKTAAAALAAHDTSFAAKRLLLAWSNLFKADKPLDTYFMLESLARMHDAKETIRTALAETRDPSRRNMLLSVTPKIDKAWAFELALEVLRTETMRQVRGQAIAVLGMINTAEAEEKLLALLETEDFAEAANVLLSLDLLHLDPSALRAAFDKSTNELARAVLANLLARDPETAASVADFVKSHATSSDEFVRFYALNAYAAIARTDVEADAALVGIYAGLDREARHLYPAVFEIVTKSADPRAEAVLQDTLADEEAAPVHRVLAAQAFVERGRPGPVVDALRATTQPEVTSYLAAVVASTPGGLAALSEISKNETHPEKKEILDRQIEVWSRARTD